MNKWIEKQGFTTPVSWSTFDVARIKLRAVKYKFYDFCTIIYLDENLIVWREESQNFESVAGEIVAYCRVFERANISEWLDAEGEAEDIPIRKSS